MLGQVARKDHQTGLVSVQPNNLIGTDVNVDVALVIDVFIAHRADDLAKQQVAA